MSKKNEEISKRIEMLEKMKGRKITRKERDKIVKEISKRRVNKNIGRALLLSAGIAIGTTGTKFLNKNDDNKMITQTNNSIDVDIAKANKDINIIGNNKNNNVFIDGLKVNVSKNPNEEKDKKIEVSTREEVKALETSDDILNFIKEIYAEEYNKNRDDKIGKNDITLKRDIYMVIVEKDNAVNGDEILRVSNGLNKKHEKINTHKSVIDVKINNTNGIENEKTFKLDNLYYNVYGADENVKGYIKNTATKVGGILDNGIELFALAEKKEAGVYSDKKEYLKARRKYEEEMIKEICNLKKERINQIMGVDDSRNIKETKIDEELER